MNIDLNCDLGEGFGDWRMGDDAALLDIVKSANIACGFHAGDAATMRRTCEMAVEHSVSIGAHIGFRDLVGFGRRHIDITPGDLKDETLYQIGALAGFAHTAGSSVTYVKPHGALYHSASKSPELADAIVIAMTEFSNRLALLGPPQSQLQKAAEAHGVDFVAEGFADRTYTRFGTLTPRSESGAVISDPNAATAQAIDLASSGTVLTSDGITIPMSVKSICVHGDSPGAVAMATSIKAGLINSRIRVESFA